MRYLEAQTKAANQVACKIAQNPSEAVLAAYTASVVDVYNRGLQAVGRKADLTEGHTIRLAQVLYKHRAYNHKKV